PFRVDGCCASLSLSMHGGRSLPPERGGENRLGPRQAHPPRRGLEGIVEGVRLRSVCGALGEGFSERRPRGLSALAERFGDGLFPREGAPRFPGGGEGGLTE